MRTMLLAGTAIFLLGGPALAQDGERRCCHVVEGAWIDGTYTPAECRALGDDYAPQGDARAAMCRDATHEEIPPMTPGAPGSPGGGSGDGDGNGGGGAGGGDGSGDGDGGPRVQRSAGEEGPQSETADLAAMRFDYETVGRASLSELGTLNHQTLEQRDFCDSMLQTGPEGRTAEPAGAECFTNLRSNAHLVTQNAGRMRNDRSMSEDERHEAAHIMQQASDTRAHADAQLEAANGN